MNPLLVAARARYVAFFATATPQHVALLDALILTRAAFAAGVGAPRQTLSALHREAFERATDREEQIFVGMRDAVRACSSFQEIPPAERAKLEREVFDAPHAIA